MSKTANDKSCSHCLYKMNTCRFSGSRYLYLYCTDTLYYQYAVKFNYLAPLNLLLVGFYCTQLSDERKYPKKTVQYIGETFTVNTFSIVKTKKMFIQYMYFVIVIM